MADKFNNPITLYKNFKMGTEIDISGTFIYNGMRDLEQMESLDQESELFSFLYHVSVGIERLQKVLLVLLEEIAEVNIEAFEKSLITHSHGELHERIKQKCSMQFTSRDNGFLQVLSRFYNTCRYDRFNIYGQYDMEKGIFTDYLRNNLDCSNDIFSNGVILTDQLKELLGRVIGSISKKYYNEIYSQASKQYIYTYELRSNSKAAKVFLPEHRKNSLQNQIFNEKIALKEFLVFLVNTKEENSFLRFLRGIEPLDIDVALANQYLEELCRGNVSQELIDAVEFLYGENSYSSDRIEMVDLIGNTRVMFEYADIKDCYDMLQSFVSGDYNINKFAVEFPEKMKLLEDDEVIEILKYVPKMCKEFTTKNKIDKTSIKEFTDYMKEVYDEFKEIILLPEK